MWIWIGDTKEGGGRLPLDSRKLLNHLEKEGGGPDPP